MPVYFNPQIMLKPDVLLSNNQQKQNFFYRPQMDVFIKTIDNKTISLPSKFEGIKIYVKSFGTIKKTNEPAYLYTITNKNGASVELSTFGATITSIKIPDKNGDIIDVVQGYDNVNSYELNPVGHAGGTIGPVANKIDNAKFIINGQTYTLEANKDNGKTHCHGGKDGFDVKNWEAKILNDGIEFKYIKKDMENGYPGNVTAKVTYKFDNDNNLYIKYNALTDKDTLINMTNHTYFNLDGCENSKENSIYKHIVELPNSSYITEINDISIPTGKLLKIEKTPFDFHTPKTIEEQINKESNQLKITDGFDHNYCVDSYDGKTVKTIAHVTSKKSGIKLTVSSNLPGFQFYTSNHLGKKSQPYGKTGTKYEKRSALCIEPQFYPNAINTKQFKEKGILKKSEEYNKEIIYSFSNLSNN